VSKNYFESEWRARFEYFAHSNSADHLVSGWSEFGLKRRLEIFSGLFKNGIIPTKVVTLDIGCGPGTYVRFLGGLECRVTGIDYSLPSLHRAVAADSQVVGRYANGEVYHLPFRDESFDLVVCMGVLQVLQNPEGALDEILRVLRPGGHVVIDFLNAWEVIAKVRRRWELLRGQPERLRTYTQGQVQSWFVERGIGQKKFVGVYLAPASFPWAIRIIRNAWIIRMFEVIPGLSFFCAHAFIMVAQKTIPSARFSSYDDES